MAGPAKLAYGEVSGVLVKPKANIELVHCVSKLLQPVVRDDAACLGEEGEIAEHECYWGVFPVAYIESGTREKVESGTREKVAFRAEVWAYSLTREPIKVPSRVQSKSPH